MDEKKNNIPNMDNCTQDCSTCPAACDIDLEQSGPSFFERLETASEYFEAMGEDNFINMLNEAVAELEAEDAAEEEAEQELGEDVEETMEEE
ncbi:MAG: hypothetical protein LIO56_05045 [Lachnospiraceae bacterium]|nr:hypothetical protein [Lachnospiraceae bacterium]